MKTVIANLKLYFPSRYFWMAYTCCIIMIMMMYGIMVQYKKDQTIFAGILMNLPFLAGFLATIVQISVFNKPVSFCLPGHRQNAKKVLLIISIIASMIFAFISAILLFGNQWPTMIALFFFINLIFFLIGVELTLITKKVLIIVWFVIFAPSLYIRPYEVLGGIIIEHPFILVGIGLLSCILVWLKLNFSQIHRNICAVPQMPIGGLWNREKLEKYNQYRIAVHKGKIKGEIKPSIEKYFLNKMNKYKYYSIGRYIWGNLYKYYGPQISNIQPLSILFIFGLIFTFGYARESSIFALFMLVLMSTVFVQLPIYSTMLVSDGRKERFYSSIGLSIAYTIYIFLFCISIITIIHIAKPLMPDITLSERTYKFYALSYTFNLLPLIIVPLVLSLKLFFHKKLFLLFMAVILIYMSFVAFIIVMEKILNIKVREIPSIVINPASVIASIVMLWAIFLAVLRRVCFKRSLI